MLIMLRRIVTYVLCRYIPIRADYIKEARRQIDRDEREPPQQIVEGFFWQWYALDPSQVVEMR